MYRSLRIPSFPLGFLCTNTLSNRNTIQFLAEVFSMYGSLLLLKFPILNLTHHLLPSLAILLSYLVKKLLEGNYNRYVSETSGMKDIDPSDWDWWCGYTLYKNVRHSGYAWKDQISRFPMLFREDNARGHWYHVFDGSG
ncbi:hypothetical protein K469DRAFT_724452 [Zopfia rhizophila CBS 207.26]|uniref:PGAP2IP C-terminal nuclease-like domain-containing protein n=1 Tax=Zopfia rhizophila CBS 207.26 TaxID=1314779 RepID=A0A6A6E9C3_9PEZI|nr:hypothetical protein K469DRAFT_724452 [Zopfia rhizophila CBS 207.26]